MREARSFSLSTVMFSLYRSSITDNDVYPPEPKFRLIDISCHVIAYEQTWCHKRQKGNTAVWMNRGDMRTRYIDTDDDQIGPDVTLIARSDRVALTVSCWTWEKSLTGRDAVESFSLLLPHGLVDLDSIWAVQVEIRADVFENHNQRMFQHREHRYYPTIDGSSRHCRQRWYCLPYNDYQQRSRHHPNNPTSKEFRQPRLQTSNLLLCRSLQRSSCPSCEFCREERHYSIEVHF